MIEWSSDDDLDLSDIEALERHASQHPFQQREASMSTTNTTAMPLVSNASRISHMTDEVVCGTGTCSIVQEQAQVVFLEGKEESALLVSSSAHSPSRRKSDACSESVLVSSSRRRSTGSSSPFLYGALSERAGGTTVARNEIPKIPTTYDELKSCIQRFKSQFKCLPPQPPPFKTCPGVYGRGCGGELEWNSMKFESSSDGFWSCEWFRSGACRSTCVFRYYPPCRLDYPRLDIVLIGPGVLQVRPYDGAEDAVAACGGITSLLQLAQIDLRTSLPEEFESRFSKLDQHGAYVEDNTECSTVNLSSHAKAVVDSRETNKTERMPQAGDTLNSDETTLVPSHPLVRERDVGGKIIGTGHEVRQKGTSHDPSCLSILFPFACYTMLRDKLHAANRILGGESMLPAWKPGIPPHTYAAFVNSDALRCPEDEVERRYASLPEYLRSSLLPFQCEGVKFGLRRHGRCLIADEMGVGKTVQAIALATCYRDDDWPLLIICPASLRLVWAEELEKWLSDLNPASVKVIEDKFDAIVVEEEGPEESSSIFGSEAKRSTVLPGGDAVGSRGLPEVVIISYRMFEHLTCQACKKAKRTDRRPSTHGGTNPGCTERGVRPSFSDISQHGPRGSCRVRSNSKTQRYHGNCMRPQRCMASLPWRTLVIDESHHLRTTTSVDQVDAQHTEAVRSLMSSTKSKQSSVRRAIFLSGTPSLTRPYDLWNQVSMLRPGLLGSTRREFADAYCGRRLLPVASKNGAQMVKAAGSAHMECSSSKNVPVARRWSCSGLTRAAELHLLLRQEVLIRRLKREVLRQLPGKRRQVIRLPKPPPRDWPKKDGKTCYEADGSDISSTDGDEDEPQNPLQRNVLSRCHERTMSPYHRLGIAKCRLATEWLLTLLSLDVEDGSVDNLQEVQDDDDASKGIFPSSHASSGSRSKCLVFAHHRAVMNHLAAELDRLFTLKRRRQRAIHFVRVDGDTDPEGRREAVERFRSDPSVVVALLSVTAAGVGLDFSSASAVVFVELPSDVSLVRQAEDRAHRQGQMNTVNVYFLCARGTCDERHWQRLSSQLVKVGMVHDGPALPSSQKLTRYAPGSSEEGKHAHCKPKSDFGGEKMVTLGEKTDRDQQYPHRTTSLLEDCDDGIEKERSVGKFCGQSFSKYALLRETNVHRFGLLVDEVTNVATQEDDTDAGNAPEKSEIVEVAAKILDREEAIDDAMRRQEAIVNGLMQREKALEVAAFVSDHPNLGKSCNPAPTMTTEGTDLPRSRADAMDEHQACPASERSEDASWWFQVSRYSHRIHFHKAEDGSRPLRLSVPQEMLRGYCETLFDDLVSYVRRNFSTKISEKKMLETQPSSDNGLLTPHRGPTEIIDGKPPTTTMVLSSIGPLAINLDEIDSIDDFIAGLHAARHFTQEWRELTPVVRQRLFNRILQTPLEDAVDAVRSTASLEGAFGCGNLRFRRRVPQIDPRMSRDKNGKDEEPGHGDVDCLANPSPALPNPPLPHAVWCEVNVEVQFGGRSKLVKYLQGFTDIQKTNECRQEDDLRSTAPPSKPVPSSPRKTAPRWCPLCVQCYKPLSHSFSRASLPNSEEEFQDGLWTLFCTPKCERKFFVASSSRGSRHAVVRRDRGICTLCGLNCTLMVRRLQSIERGTKGWIQRRRELLETEYEDFVRKAGKAAQQLIERATPGRAWQADHIIPVYAGGGQCDIDNLRTLCTGCHLDVTRAQARDRAQRRRLQKRKASSTGAIRGPERSFFRSKKKSNVLTDSEDE